MNKEEASIEESAIITAIKSALRLHGNMMKKAASEESAPEERSAPEITADTIRNMTKIVKELELKGKCGTCNIVKEIISAIWKYKYIRDIKEVYIDVHYFDGLESRYIRVFDNKVNTQKFMEDSTAVEEDIINRLFKPELLKAIENTDGVLTEDSWDVLHYGNFTKPVTASEVSNGDVTLKIGIIKKNLNDKLVMNQRLRDYLVWQVKNCIKRTTGSTDNQHTNVHKGNNNTGKVLYDYIELYGSYADISASTAVANLSDDTEDSSSVRYFIGKDISNSTSWCAEEESLRQYLRCIMDYYKNNDDNPEDTLIQLFGLDQLREILTECSTDDFKMSSVYEFPCLRIRTAPAFYVSNKNDVFITLEELEYTEDVYYTL